MINLFLAILFSLTLWTVFAVINKGHFEEEILDSLGALGKNFAGLFVNIRKLFSLLVKDALHSSSRPISDFLTNKAFRRQSTIAQNGKELSPFIKSIETSKQNSNFSPEFNEIDEDETISDFCTEVVDFIEEEDQKVA